jgi:hypothetical protein
VNTLHRKSPPSGLRDSDDIPPFLKDKHAPSSSNDEFIAEEMTSDLPDEESQTSDEHWWDERPKKAESYATPISELQSETPDRVDLPESDERSDPTEPVSEPADLNSMDEEENPS